MQANKSQSITGITTKVVLMTAFWLLLFWVLFKIREVVFLLFFAFVLSSALYPPVNWLRKRRFPSHISILIFYLVFLLLLTLLGFLLGNLLSEEWSQFLIHLPKYLDMAQTHIKHLPLGLNQTNVSAEISANARNLVGQGFHVALSGLEYVFTVFKSVLGVATVLIFTFFFLSDSIYFERTFLKLVPLEYQADVDRLLRRVIQKIGAYVRGQFMIMCIIGTLIAVTLGFLGIPYALILGLLGFLLDAIPIIGPIISAVFGTMIALGYNPSLAIWVALSYFIIQHIESYFLSPAILGRSLGLHPFWILLSILVAGLALGLPGLLLAIPLGVVLSILVEEFCNQRLSSNRKEQSPGPASNL